MKHSILLMFLMGILFSRLIAQCENYSLKQEVLMTQNIALVQGMQVIDDSVEVHIIKNTTNMVAHHKRHFPFGRTS